MAAIKDISEILEIARIAQYLAFNDQSKKLFLKGNSNARLPYMITCERLSVQWQYDTDPTDSTLRGTANYLYDLLGIYGIQAEVILAAQGGVAPIVTGPSNQSVTLGDVASFTIGVTSSLSYSVAWYIDGVLVPGQIGLTYSFTPTLDQSGSIVSAIVTNGAGATPSANAMLTVTTALLGYWYVGPVNYYSLLNMGVDNITFNSSFNIVDGQPFQILVSPSSLGNNMNHVYKTPVSQGVKTSWLNTDLNNGNIPDQAFRTNIVIGSWNYEVSRDEISIDANINPSHPSWNMQFS